MTVSIPGYRLESQIAAGALGAVWKATQRAMDRPVAIRILAPVLSRDARIRARFLAEARTLARLKHPNIVEAIDAGESGDSAYLVTEFADGPSLQVLLSRQGRLSEPEALSILAECARALQHAHERGLVHRDLKPSSVILTLDRGVKVCDFGLPLQQDLARSQGRPLSSPEVIPPELVRGAAAPDPRSDLYSLGATFYRMVTGVPPFAGGDVTEAMVRHAPELSPAASRIALRLLEKDPSKRHRSARELLIDIERARSAVPRRGPPAAALLAGVAGAVALLILGVVLLAGGSEKAPAAVRSPAPPPAPLAAAPSQPEISAPAPEPNPPARPSDPEETFRNSADTIRERAAWLWDRQSSTRLTDPYQLLLEQAEKNRGTRFETMWLKEIAAYVREQEERIDPIWSRIRAEADLHEKTGDLDKALEALARFPEDLRFFKREEPGHLATRAGVEHEAALARIHDAVQTRLGSDMAALKSAADARDFDRAWALHRSLQGRAPAADLDPIADRLVQAEFDALLAPPLSHEKADAARERMLSLAQVHAGRPAGDRAKRLAEEAGPRTEAALAEARSRAAEVFSSDVLPGILARLARRDTVGARASISALFYGDAFAAIRAGLQIEGLDLSAHRSELTAPILREGVPLAERIQAQLAAIQERPEAATVRQALFYARAAALLEELYRRALEGLDASKRDRAMLKEARTDLIRSASRLAIKILEPEPNRTFACETRSKTLHVSPVGETTLDGTDVVTFAAVTYGGDHPPVFDLAAALHYALTGDVRNARAALEKVTDAALAVGLDPIRAQVEEEFAKLPPEPEEKPEAGRSKPKPRLPFAGKVKEFKHGFLEVTYDFADAGQLDDFETVDWFGDSVEIAYESKGNVRLKGSGILYWKAPLQGDAAIEVTFTSAGQSVGAVVHGEGNQRGYATFVDYDFNPGGGRNRWGSWFNDQLLLVKLPVDLRNLQRSHLDAKAGASLSDGMRYTIWSQRQGDSITGGIGSLKASGQDGEFHEGKSGLWMSRTELTLHSIKITAKPDSAWMERNKPE